MRISISVCLILCAFTANNCFAQFGVTGTGERPTLVRTNDPRPDILPRPFYESHSDYRAQYNRPTFVGGWVAYNISRTSQEAMSWKENYCAGNYDKHHMPAMCKTYYYPKPWEVLQTGARPDSVQTIARPNAVWQPEPESLAVPQAGGSSRKSAVEQREAAATAEEPEISLSPSDRQ